MTEVAADSLAQLLLEHPAGPAEPLVCTVDGELTRTEFLAEVRAVADSLAALGVAPGHAVTSFVSRCPSR